MSLIRFRRGISSWSSCRQLVFGAIESGIWITRYTASYSRLVRVSRIICACVVITSDFYAGKVEWSEEDEKWNFDRSTKKQMSWTRNHRSLGFRTNGAQKPAYISRDF